MTNLVKDFSDGVKLIQVSKTHAMSNHTDEQLLVSSPPPSA
jgi:hypothetical protein